MLRTRGLAALLALLVAAPGCMTIDTQLGRGYEGPYIYSGVRKDLEIMGPAFLHLSFGWVILTLFDLPLSLVADTLLLPVSIARDAERDAKIEEKTQVATDRPALIHAKPGEADTARRLFDECRKLLRQQDAQLADCWAVDAKVSTAGGATVAGAQLELAAREALELHQDEGISVDWRDPTFAVEGERVRIQATRRSTREPSESALVLLVGSGGDGGWRIVEETSVGWPER